MSLLCWSSMGWIDPLVDKVREGNLLYHSGKYDEALDKYVNAQINNTEIPQLNFNIADTQYKRSKYNEAAQLYEKAIKSGDLETKARSSFNMGNTFYRQGKMKEALDCYKKAVDFVDEAETKAGSKLSALKDEARYNYEYVEKKMQEKEQKNQNQKDQQQKEDAKKDDEQSDENKGKDKEEQKSQEDKKQSESQNTQEKSEDKKPEPLNRPDEDKPSEQRLPQHQGQKQMSREDAERLLDALNQSEKEARALRRDTQRLQHRPVEKDW
ncbi:MAG TPA: tetratricopeptide repeat protein [Candidatus Brocadiaceae bacterium]